MWDAGWGARAVRRIFILSSRRSDITISGPNPCGCMTDSHRMPSGPFGVVTMAQPLRGCVGPLVS
jgi:hypothetical protein